MKNRVLYRIIIYIIILGIVAAVAFAPNAGKDDPDITYWIVGGCLAGLWLIFVIVNELLIYKKQKKNKDNEQ